MEFNARQKKVLEATESKILCLAAASSGKALLNSDNIPTTEGFKQVSEIKVGDYLFDRYGKPTKILGVYPQGKLPVYELTFGDGRKAKCSKDHIWYVHKRTWKGESYYREKTLEEILNDEWYSIDKRGHYCYNYSIPCAEAVQYKERKYDIHPYIIGAFLGDGCCRNSRLTISSENNEIPNHIAELLGDNVIVKKRHEKSDDWIFNYSNGNKIYTKILPKELINYSYDKSIPIEYKYGSIEQRLELIRGLMDTDGNVALDRRSSHRLAANLSFSSTSYKLILDVKEVLGSLGYVSTISEDIRPEKYTKGKAYSLSINMTNEDKYKLFWLPLKRDKALLVKDIKQNKIYNRTSIREIKDLGYQAEMTCFYVDNDEHVFLMNDFVVTHNTKVLTERIKRIIDKGVNPKDIVAITFTNLAMQEMKTRLGEYGNKIFIGTIHSYANKICMLNGVNNYKLIESGNFDALLEKVVKIPINNYPRIKHLLVDECQDISPLEYQFLKRIPSENVFYVGDSRQNIYQFRSCTDEFLINMWRDNSFTKYYLNENYRNAPNILKFANDIVMSMQQLSPHPIPMKTKNGIVERCSFYDALDELEMNGKWNTWYILARTNNEVETIQNILNDRDIPNITFKKGDLTPEELDAALTSNKVKVLTIHSAKGDEQNNVIVVGARMYNEEERKIAYVAATRAKNALYWCPSIVKKQVRNNQGDGKTRAARKAGNIFKNARTIEF